MPPRCSGDDSLEIARERIGLTRVLVTCDDDNVESIRTIEKNGGVLESIVSGPDGDEAQAALLDFDGRLSADVPARSLTYFFSGLPSASISMVIVLPAFVFTWPS